jgi:hypothetical protein
MENTCAKVLATENARPSTIASFDGDACVLAQEWRHGMGGIAKQAVIRYD